MSERANIVRRVPMPGAIPIAPVDGELLEMVNLSEADTGVPGVLYVSTAQGSHGPRVEWYPGRPGREVPCLAATIAAEPQLFNQNLPGRVADAAGRVRRWVASNHVALLRFWNDGVSWTRSEVNDFLDGLKRLT